jgi:leucyl/phenylalanyl-tRNA--protein transferase
VAPIEPPPTPWALPDAAALAELGDTDVAGTGADLAPGTLLAAYRRGLFPMPLSRRRAMAWWCPDPRGVLPLDGLRVTRSLRQSMRRFEVRTDTAFADVVAACADPSRDHGWITPAIAEAYAELHRLGWAHSVEAFDVDGTLVGGLYGVSVGGLFAGESMFHHARDASKVALVALVERLRRAGATLLDIQWLTPHLASLGATEIPRVEYLACVAHAVTLEVVAFADVGTDRQGDSTGCRAGA